MGPNHIVSFGPYRLDAGNAQLWCESQPVRLTAKALQVLSYLAERPHQLVTKDELFAAVWPETVVSDATLASNIQAVRQATRSKSPYKPIKVQKLASDANGFRSAGFSHHRPF